MTNLDRIRALLAVANIDTVAQQSGVPRRTLFRIKAGGDPRLKNLLALEQWAKNRRLPKEAE